MKLHESEFDQHTWLKVTKNKNSLNIYLGTDGWFSPFGIPKYKRIAKIDLKVKR